MHGAAGSGKAGGVWQRVDWRGMLRSGAVRQAWLRLVRYGLAGEDKNESKLEKTMEDIDIEKVQKKMSEFTNNLDKFLESEANEVADYADLIQELLAFGVFYSYLNCANPEEVDWVIRRIKQMSIEERNTFDKKYRNREWD